MAFEELRVALVHDWLTGMRGGEKVLEALADLFPHAPIYTLLHNPGSVSPSLESHPIRPSLLQKLPMSATKYRHYLPLMPALIEGMRIEPCDLVLSTSSCVAKGIHKPEGAVHACYVHSPMRYLYDRYNDYFAPGRASWPTRAAMRIVRSPLQHWDIASTRRVDALACNSSFVAERILRIYGRAARVMSPPVDVERFAEARRQPDDYYLMVCALVPYKNVDLAIEAFRGWDRRLVIAGSGPLKEKLLARRPPNVEFLGWVDDEAIPPLVAGCRAFLMPNVEDFGIAPVEAMAAGRPVIALGAGGVQDSVRDLDRWRAGMLAGPDGPTGLFFDNESPAGLRQAIERFEAEESAFAPNAIAQWARRFDRGHFSRRIVDWINELLEAPSRRVA